VKHPDKHGILEEPYMKKLRFPAAHTILIFIAIVVALLTWLIPAGK